MIEKTVLQTLSKLDQLDEVHRMRVLSETDTQRNELLEVLLRQLETTSSKNVQAGAIYLIGRNRLDQGVPHLLKRIDFDPGWKQIPEPLPLWEHYPAMEALINIGLPSVAPAIELLATEKNDLRRSLAVKVIRYIEGPEVAGFVLEKAYSKENDAARKANLREAISRLERLVRATT